MEHPQIDDDNVVERYLLDTLGSAEREAFEDHYLDCQPCLGNLETARRLRDGLRAVAAEETLRVAVATSLWSRLRRGLPVAALVVMATSLWLTRGALERADQANKTAIQAASETELLAKRLDEATAPRQLTEPIALVATRSNEPSAMVLRRDALGDTVVIEVDLGTRATLSGEIHWRHGDKILWRGELAHLDDGVLRLSAPTASLEPGAHVLELLDSAGVTRQRWRFEVR